MSNLRFRVGDQVRCTHPKKAGEIGEIYLVGPIPALMRLTIFGTDVRCIKKSDYVVRTSWDDGFFADDKYLAPYPDPSDWDSFERETGLQRLTGEVKEEV